MLLYNQQSYKFQEEITKKLFFLWRPTEDEGMRVVGEPKDERVRE